MFLHASTLFRLRKSEYCKSSENEFGGVGGFSCHWRVTIPCVDLWPLLQFSPNDGCLLAAGYSSSVWHVACCVWNGQVDTDALYHFNRAAMLMHNPFEIRCSPPQL